MASALDVRQARSTHEERLLAVLRDSLHEMSQPMMVLLCSFEYAAGLDSVDEMKQAIGFGVDACARLSETVRAMQMHVKQGMERQPG